MYGSNLFNGDDTYKEEGSLQNFSYGLAKDDSWMHVLVTNDSVLLVVLLHLHTDVENEVSHLVDGQLFNSIIQHIVELDQHGSQHSFLGMGYFVGFCSCQLGDLLTGQAWFSDNGADSYVGIDQVDSSVSSWI